MSSFILQAADALEVAVEKVLDAGFRTPDIMQVGPRPSLLFFLLFVMSRSLQPPSHDALLAAGGPVPWVSDLIVVVTIRLMTPGTTGGHDAGRVQAHGRGGQEGPVRRTTDDGDKQRKRVT